MNRAPARTDLTAERLRELFLYDRETGEFRRRSLPYRLAGTRKRKGYIAIRIEGWVYFAHRLAWLYVYGEWPKDQIDHRDRNKANNAISNLREATRAQNQHNIPRKGYSYNKTEKKYRARIRINGQELDLGFFRTASEAQEAHRAAQLRYHGDYAGPLVSSNYRAVAS